MWVWVVVIVLGVAVGIWIWKKITEPVVAPPPPPIPPRDPADVENELDQNLDEFETVRDNMHALGDVDGEYCPEAIRLAKKIINLLNEYKSLPNMNQATYDRLRAKFDEEELRLDSWCTDYDPPALN